MILFLNELNCTARFVFSQYHTFIFSQGSVVADVETDRKVAPTQAGKTQALADFQAALDAAAADGQIGNLVVDKDIQVSIKGN